MKLSPKYVIVVLIVAIVSYMCYNIIEKVKEKELIAKHIQSLPGFNFTNLYNEPFESNYIQKGQACLLMYFHPECEHCCYEAEQFINYIPELSPYQIVMISYDSIPNLKQFEERYHLNEMENVTILHDPNGDFPKIFGTKLIPTSFIYSKKHKLKKIFKGEVKIEALIKYLKDEETAQF